MNSIAYIGQKAEYSIRTFRMDPLRLARVNFGLFCSLLSMGTAPQRLCKAMNLTESEYYYLADLATQQ